MHCKLRPRLGLALLALLALAALPRPAAAQDTVFNLSYSGAPFGNTASATGTITLNTSLINNPGFTETFSTPFVTALTLTVTGASSGNGTFTLADYDPADFGDIIFDTHGGTLDFTKPLIGQPTAGAPWGTTHDSSSGDFNLFTGITGIADGAPEGTFYFQLTTDVGQEDPMYLTEFSPAGTSAVPEPSQAATLGVGGLGLLALGLLARRRRRLGDA